MTESNPTSADLVQRLSDKMEAFGNGELLPDERALLLSIVNAGLPCVEVEEHDGLEFEDEFDSSFTAATFSADTSDSPVLRSVARWVYRPTPSSMSVAKSNGEGYYVINQLCPPPEVELGPAEPEEPTDS